MTVSLNFVRRERVNDSVFKFCAERERVNDSVFKFCAQIGLM